MYSSSKESVGTIAWWGFTPAIDLLKMRNEANESNAENYARQLLLLHMMLQSNKQLSLQDRSEYFLEIFGNSMIREKSSEYLKKLSDHLLKEITSDSKIDQNVFDYSSLKFIEKDILENLFKFWRSNSIKGFDASQFWDLRVRQDLGIRYDSIPNVFDWDVSITLHQRGADQINNKEYCDWRRNGVAFELREASYAVSNKSLASMRKLPTKDMDKVVRWGYWGDIVCSPMFAYGIDTSHFPEMGKTANDKKMYSSAAVSLENVKKYLHEISTKKEYKYTKPDACRIDEVVEEETCPDEAYSMTSLPIDVSFRFLPVNCFPDLPRRHRSKFVNEKISVLYIGCAQVHHLADERLMSRKETPDYQQSKAYKLDTANLFKDLGEDFQESVSFENEKHLGLCDITTDDCLLIVENIL
ncbi:Dynein assembly factor 3, axonemal [Cichlidogyrus casuarinus]|uniref:Dynein assembly factor 3, axonemal n=1 Tax=Cichlidogyrus casuarinus TaxID=1844966 RepID=A0ABD2QFL0_9PLAT